MMDYPSNKFERETFLRLKLAQGSSELTERDVERIERARRKRQLRGYSY